MSSVRSPNRRAALRSLARPLREVVTRSERRPALRQQRDTPPITAFIVTGAGFLAAVLWFDLMFDVQLRRSPGPDGLPSEEILSSIAAYYRRVTTTARPMNLAVAVVMALTLAALVVQLARAEAPVWVGSTCLGLAALAIGVAASHTVRAAVRLGARTDSRERQSALARSVYRDHKLSLAAILGLIVLQLALAR